MGRGFFGTLQCTIKYYLRRFTPDTGIWESSQPDNGNRVCDRLPFGAILLRLIRSKLGVCAHADPQLTGYDLMIAGLATGIRVGKIIDQLHNNGHTILGTIIAVLLLLLPFLGFWHHYRFKKTQSTSGWTLIHKRLGGIFPLLRIIDGGVGLKLADNTTGGVIAYAVVAGVIGVVFIVMVVLLEENVILKEKQTPDMEQT